jgi:hypothetical protein
VKRFLAVTLLGLLAMSGAAQAKPLKACRAAIKAADRMSIATGLEVQAAEVMGQSSTPANVSAFAGVSGILTAATSDYRKARAACLKSK